MSLLDNLLSVVECVRMKRVLVLLVIIVVIVSIPPSTHEPLDLIASESFAQHELGELFSISSASGNGDARAAVAFASREVNDLSLEIMNSFVSTSVHSGVLDLSSYLIPGGSLYEVEIGVDSITAS